jgi:hypothetical protein
VTDWTVRQCAEPGGVLAASVTAEAGAAIVLARAGGAAPPDQAPDLDVQDPYQRQTTQNTRSMSFAVDTTSSSRPLPPMPVPRSEPSSSAELNVWPRSADRHGAGVLRHLPDLVAELRGNPKLPSE